MRDVAPDILLFANFGAVQLNYGYGPDDARRAVETIGADALFLHFNPLQEAVQAGGDRNWTGLYRKVESLAASLDVPIVGKEVGNGIGAAVAKRLVGLRPRGGRCLGGGGHQLERGGGLSSARSRDPGRGPQLRRLGNPDRGRPDRRRAGDPPPLRVRERRHPGRYRCRQGDPARRGAGRYRRADA